MKFRGLGYALNAGAVLALLAGCGGLQSPIAPPGAMPQGRATLRSADRSGSWMLPEAKNEDLLYVVHEYANDVSVYSYPRGVLVGSIANTNENAIGDCVDRVGDVFIVNLDTTKLGPGSVVEYAHGGTTPIETLTPGEEPTGCAVDPTTGDLAVTRNGSVRVYHHAKGRPANYYSLRMSGDYYCAYDDKGNLFLNGLNRSTHDYQLAELPARQKHMTLLTVPKRSRIRPLVLGGVQWDGEHVVIGNGTYFIHDKGYSAVYQVRIGRVRARILSATTPKRAMFPGSSQFWIEGNTFISPSSSLHGTIRVYKFGLWTYPKGHLIRFVIDPQGPWAVTVSLAPH